MYCIRCGSKNGEEAAFCYNCGAAMVKPPAASQAQNFAPGNYQQPPPTTPAQPPYQPQPYYQPPSPMPVSPTGPNAYMPGYGFAPTPAQFYPGYFHPVLTGAVGVPFPVVSQPQNYYSYVNQEGKVVLAKRAGFWSRVAASLVDSLILGVPFFIIIMWYILSLPSADLRALLRDPNRAIIPAWVNLASSLISYAYYVFLLVAWGQSIGKRVMKIKVIRLDGRKPDWLTAFLRQILGYTLSGIAFGLGFLWVAWDAQKQGWHDKLARTLVVETQELEEGRDFYRPGATPGASG